MTFLSCRNSANKDLCLAYAVLLGVPFLFVSAWNSAFQSYDHLGNRLLHPDQRPDRQDQPVFANGVWNRQL